MIIAPTTNVPSNTVKTSSWRDSRPVIDYEKCTRCAICWKFCPDIAIELVSGTGRSAPNERFKRLEAPLVNYDHCKGCGICAEECPFDAIEMVREGEI